MGEYEYKYEYLDWYLRIGIHYDHLSHNKPKVNTLLDIKSIKVKNKKKQKTMPICAIVCNLWYLVEIV